MALSWYYLTYIKFEMTDETNRVLSLRRIEHCINDVCVSMVAYLLKVNDEKTVALVLASQNNQVKHNITVIKIGDCDITPSPAAARLEPYHRWNHITADGTISHRYSRNCTGFP